MAQFIKCRFRPMDTRLYTYANHGDPVQPGDFVKVEDARGGDGAWKRIEVVEVDVEEPTAFACKAILGIYNPDAEPAREREPQPVAAGGSPLDGDELEF